MKIITYKNRYLDVGTAYSTHREIRIAHVFLSQIYEDFNLGKYKPNVSVLLK